MAPSDAEGCLSIAHPGEPVSPRASRGLHSSQLPSGPLPAAPGSSMMPALQVESSIQASRETSWVPTPVGVSSSS